MDQPITDFYILDETELSQPSKFIRKMGPESKKSSQDGKLHEIALKMRQKMADIQLSSDP